MALPGVKGLINKLKILLTIAGERELSFTVDVAGDTFFEYFISFG